MNIRIFKYILLTSLLVTGFSGCMSSPQETATIDDVIWVKERPSQMALLYILVTSAKTSHEDLCKIVVRNSVKALTEAEVHKGKDFNIVFFVRNDSRSITGCSTGFSVTQLNEISKLSFKDGIERVKNHSWSILSNMPEKE